jgi:hypothetical protein
MAAILPVMEAVSPFALRPHSQDPSKARSAICGSRLKNSGLIYLPLATSLSGKYMCLDTDPVLYLVDFL